MCIFFLTSGFSQEVIPDWQQAASNILVAVGKKHINDIMEEILSKFQPGMLPHFFVVQTLASLSDSNGNTHTHMQKYELFIDRASFLFMLTIYEPA